MFASLCIGLDVTGSNRAQALIQFVASETLRRLESFQKIGENRLALVRRNRSNKARACGSISAGGQCSNLGVDGVSHEIQSPSEIKAHAVENANRICKLQRAGKAIRRRLLSKISFLKSFEMKRL